MEENIEDWKIYFADSFLATDQFDEDLSGDSETIKNPTEIQMSTGINSGSENMLWYKSQLFNPSYGEMIAKLRVNNKNNIKAFWGFRSNLTEPTANMTESHIGFFLENGKFYVTSANGTDQQKAELVGIDLTKVYEFKIKDCEFWMKPLPQVVSYLGLPKIDRENRVWKLLQSNDTYPQKDQLHYLMFYIENNTNADKVMTINRVIYKEDYPD